jgi:hypothetical protein
MPGSTPMRTKFSGPITHKKLQMGFIWIILIVDEWDSISFTFLNEIYEKTLFNVISFDLLYWLKFMRCDELVDELNNISFCNWMEFMRCHCLMEFPSIFCIVWNWWADVANNQIEWYFLLTFGNWMEFMRIHNKLINGLMEFPLILCTEWNLWEDGAK